MTSLKKSIAVLALSLPLAASAQQAAAPAPLYQIYGTLNLNYQYVEVSKPTPGAAAANMTGRVGPSTDSTNFGIKGVADTGQFGLGVVYQCETQANLDGIATSTFCSRNSRLGLTSPYGTVFYGNWDTPYKSAWYGTKADDAFGNTDIYNATALMGHPGFKQRGSAGALGATGPTASATFEVRAPNSIAYHSPNIQGVSFKVQYVANEFASLDGRSAPTLYSAGVNYDKGPLSILAAGERHEDWYGLNVSGMAGAPTVATNKTLDSAFKVGAGYELGSGFGTTTVGAVWEYMSLGWGRTTGLAATAVKEWHRQAVMVNLKHRTGNHEFRARYEYADNGDCKLVGGGTCNADVGLGAQNYGLGYAYYLSKAAQVYAFWTKIDNERRATYEFTSGGPALLATGGWTAGADPMGIGLGMRYAF
jgi:predicted porin